MQQARVSAKRKTMQTTEALDRVAGRAMCNLVACVMPIGRSAKGTEATVQHCKGSFIHGVTIDISFSGSRSVAYPAFQPLKFRRMTLSKVKKTCPLKYSYISVKLLLNDRVPAAFFFHREAALFVCPAEHTLKSWFCTTLGAAPLLSMLHLTGHSCQHRIVYIHLRTCVGCFLVLISSAPGKNVL